MRLVQEQTRTNGQEEDSMIIWTETYTHNDLNDRHHQESSNTCNIMPIPLFDDIGSCMHSLT